MRLPIVLVVGFLAGSAGGITSHLLTTSRSGDLRELRATRIELVDGKGKTTAFIGTDSEHDTALVFLDDHNRERMKIGVWPSSYTPTLVMAGDDGQERIAFHLSVVDDRPMILLRDHERTRVHLGYYQNDTGTPDENWGLAFFGPHDDSVPLLESGIFQDYKSKKLGGFLYFLEKDGRLHELK